MTPFPAPAGISCHGLARFEPVGVGFNLTNMNLFKRLMARQVGNWIDRSPIGRGNRAARRAIATKRGLEHIEFADEPIYTDRPAILQRGHLLLLVDKYPHMRSEINKCEL